MMTPHQMEFLAVERMREAHEAARVRRLLRATEPAGQAAPSWRSRLTMTVVAGAKRRLVTG